MVYDQVRQAITHYIPFLCRFVSWLVTISNAFKLKLTSNAKSSVLGHSCGCKENEQIREVQLFERKQLS